MIILYLTAYLLSCTVPKLWLIIGQIFADERTLSLGLIPCQYHHKWYIAKIKFFGLHYATECIFNNFYVIRPKATEFGEITLPLWLLRRSRSSKVTEFGNNQKLICDFRLVINTNLVHLAPFPRYSVRWVQNRYIRLPLLCLTPPTEGFPWDDLRKILPGCQQMASVPEGVEILPKISVAWVGCTNVTDRRQTDRRQTTDRRTADDI